MNDTIINVEGVSKKYCRNQKQSMLYGLQDIALDIFNIAGTYDSLRRDEFWALSDISLELKRGEVLGVLGANGSGKSTLLKLISGIIYPDSGFVTTRGKVGELIEVSAGFHPMLTGRENIYVKGTILGLSKKEIDLAFDEIVDFAELDEFIDMPIKYYSSGMHMRLGFAIIAYSRPDILLVDEILSVGDVSFRAKCFNKISEIIDRTGVIFVSHNMGNVSRICNSVMVLSTGTSSFYGNNVSAGIDCYYSVCAAENAPLVAGSGKATLHDIFIESGRKENGMTVQDQMEKLILNMNISASRQIPKIEIVFTITNLEQENIIQCNSYFDDISLVNSSDQLHVRACMGCTYLSPGIYGISISIHEENRGEILAKYRNCLSFRIAGNRVGHSLIQAPAVWEMQD